MTAEAASALLADKRGLLLGVSSRESVGFHSAEELRGQGAEVAVSLRPSRGAFMSELAAAGYTPVELEASDESSIERAVQHVG
ncbi:MAG TPA: hypothetical protein VNG33_16735, partial [Polyangiaceae bacterium]|nr:hypothetical protein [Polyangiaceae bacterium]